MARYYKVLGCNIIHGMSTRFPENKCQNSVPRNQNLSLKIRICQFVFWLAVTNYIYCLIIKNMTWMCFRKQGDFIFKINFNSLWPSDERESHIDLGKL